MRSIHHQPISSAFSPRALLDPLTARKTLPGHSNGATHPEHRDGLHSTCPHSGPLPSIKLLLLEPDAVMWPHMCQLTSWKKMGPSDWSGTTSSARAHLSEMAS